MPEQKRKYVNIPEAMWNNVQKILEEQPHLGFKSVADFVASAVRTNAHNRVKVERKGLQELRHSPDL
jgi:hypothetical protein